LGADGGTPFLAAGSPHSKEHKDRRRTSSVRDPAFDGVFFTGVRTTSGNPLREPKVRGLSAGGRRIRTLGPRSAATPLSDRKSLLYPSSSPKAGLVLRTEGLDRFAARSWLLLGVCPCKSMLRRKRRKPLAGAKGFPAVRHEPTNPDEGLARAGAADRQGVPLLGGEQPVGCALLCRNSLRQLLAALTILRARPQGYGR
jgi:hypothetical protein